MTQPLPPSTTPFVPGDRLDELPGYFEANRAFHRRIVVCSDNPVRLWVRDQLALRVDHARPSGSVVGDARACPQRPVGRAGVARARCGHRRGDAAIAAGCGVGCLTPGVLACKIE
jgi:DNA-binding GntR family transcriptional regulator